MIIMINGAFGVGKTTVSKLVNEAIPNSMIFDPEEVGYMLRNIVFDDIKHPDELVDDFQAMELWRVLTVKVASEIQNKYKINLVIPMTIRNYDYFKYIYNGFREFDNDIYHFCLVADKDIIHARLIKRGDLAGSWAFEQTDKCIENYLKNDFSEYIDTSNMTPDDISKYIISKCNRSPNYVQI